MPSSKPDYIYTTNRGHTIAFTTICPDENPAGILDDICYCLDYLGFFDVYKEQIREFLVGRK